MQNISFLETNQIYSCSADGIVPKENSVSHSEFYKFNIMLKLFEKLLRKEELHEEEYWKCWIQKLRRYRYHLCSTPLPFNYPQLTVSLDPKFLLDHLKECEYRYPQLSEQAEALASQVILLSMRPENPLLETLLKILDTHLLNTALLLADSRMIPAMETFLSDLPQTSNLEVISCSQLRNGKCFQKLVAFGTYQWFPDYVFSAPRAFAIDLICYQWISRSHSSKNVFEGGISVPIVSSTFNKVQQLSPNIIQIEAEEFIPQISLKLISKKVAYLSSVDSSEQLDTLRAQLFLLDGNEAVFLEAEDTSKHFVIDLEGDIGDANESSSCEDSEKVKKIPTSQISPGMFILLRKGSTEDYILPIANQYLGKDYLALRKLQEIWKTKLQEKTYQEGEYSTLCNLRKFGSIKANPLNLQNWISERQIKTRDYLDFKAIMTFIGLDEEAESYWDCMIQIASAHQKAGYFVRRSLLSLVRESDLKELKQRGRMEFKLPEFEEICFIAIKILKITEETYPIPYSQLSRLFELDPLEY